MRGRQNRANWGKGQKWGKKSWGEATHARGKKKRRGDYAIGWGSEGGGGNQEGGGKDLLGQMREKTICLLVGKSGKGKKKKKKT